MKKGLSHLFFPWKKEMEVSMLVLLRLFVYANAVFGLVFALVLLLGWLSGKIEVHINIEPY
nr:hypothetical protein [uncultured Oscillibacter sp.]